MNGLPEFELVDHPDPQSNKDFSLIRLKGQAYGSDPQQFANDIREEVCIVCNNRHNVNTCMGVLYSEREGISGRITKEEEQYKRCLLLIRDFKEIYP